MRYFLSKLRSALLKKISGKTLKKEFYYEIKGQKYSIFAPSIPAFNHFFEEISEAHYKMKRKQEELYSEDSGVVVGNKNINPCEESDLLLALDSPKHSKEKKKELRNKYNEYLTLKRDLASYLYNKRTFCLTRSKRYSKDYKICSVRAKFCGDRNRDGRTCFRRVYTQYPVDT